ncbi:MAG: SWIM zinc finger domain-containing protein [Methanothrix sp.]|nr:SWIM zinc finger domain-containing protein [Methanothrix sp.]
MLNRILAASPVTQIREAVKQLITFHNHGIEPQEMPDLYRLSVDMVLVLNNKKDAYYVTTPKTCSCPAAVYNPGPCKHSRKYFPQSMRQVATEGPRMLARQGEDGIRPKLPAFRPFDTLPSEEKATAEVA